MPRLSWQRGVGFEDRKRDPQAEEYRTILQSIDPEALLDSAGGFQALSGIRLQRSFKILSDATTLPRLLLVAAFLGILRYVSKFLVASVHSVRVKARGSGHRASPPTLDMTNRFFSPVTVAMQALSSLLSCAGLSRRTTFFDILHWMGQECGPHVMPGFRHHLRKGAVAMSVSLHWRHRVRFSRMPFTLATTIDPEATLEGRIAVQRDLFIKKRCCIGHTAADLREKLLPSDISCTGSWPDFWDRILFTVFDGIDLCISDVEGLHASQQKLIVGKAGGGCGFTSFCAKSVNRRASSQYETAVHRNLLAAPLAVW